MSAVSKQSLTTTGMPCNGPTGRPVSARARSTSSACSRAAGLSVTTALSAGP